LQLALVVVLPVGAVGAVGCSGVASAKKAPPDTGGISCTWSATGTLSVPYINGGTEGTRISVNTVSGQTLSSCTATGNTLTGGTPGTATVKTKFTKAVADTPPYPQDCNAVVANQGSKTVPAFKEKVTWSDGTTSAVSFSGGTSQRGGISVTGTVTKGSFVGDSVTLSGDVAVATIVAIETCASDGGPPVGTLEFAGGSTLTFTAP
jgi:hypothetical protein